MTWQNNNAARMVALVFGVLAGLGGLTHGIGEVLQGNVAPAGIFIPSWTQGPIATNLGGDPALTIVPNLLGTGVLTIIVSLMIIIWATAFITRKNGGLILILLSIILLLVGGGVAPPVVGVLAGVAGLGITTSLSWWRKHLPVNLRRFLATLWPWIFGISILNGVFLVIGSVILVYLFNVNNPNLFTYSFLLSVLLLLLMILTGRAYDIQKQAQSD
ncbi:MAG: hypothetical protein LUP95_04145 [Euryarchaeota archaeon]|nr:hypothetical protein [Euryarchaeota archaeon]